MRFLGRSCPGKHFYGESERADPRDELVTWKEATRDATCDSNEILVRDLPRHPGDSQGSEGSQGAAAAAAAEGNISSSDASGDDSNGSKLGMIEAGRAPAKPLHLINNEVDRAERTGDISSSDGNPAGSHPAELTKILLSELPRPPDDSGGKAASAKGSKPGMIEVGRAPDKPSHLIYDGEVHSVQRDDDDTGTGKHDPGDVWSPKVEQTPGERQAKAVVVPSVADDGSVRTRASGLRTSIRSTLDYVWG